MTTTEQDAAVERVARAICKTRGWNPNTCVMGGGSASHDGKSSSYCSVYMWQNCVPDARAAIAALATTPPCEDSGEVARLRDAVRLTISEASYHLRKYRPYCLDALEAALEPQAGDV